MCCSWIQRNEVEFSRGTKFSPGCLLSSFLPSSACSSIFVLLRMVLHAPQTHLRVPQLFTEWQRRKLCWDFCLFFFFFFVNLSWYPEALHVILTEATPQTAAVFTLVGPEKENHCALEVTEASLAFLCLWTRLDKQATEKFQVYGFFFFFFFLHSLE